MSICREEIKLPSGNENKIIIICTEEQEKYIKERGCIACDEEVCNYAFCGANCAYEAKNIEYRRS